MGKKYKYVFVTSKGIRQEWYERNGEFRAPKKGEFYLSGAIPEVYKSPNDLESKFHIVRRVESPEPHIYVNGFEYRLHG